MYLIDSGALDAALDVKIVVAQVIILIKMRHLSNISVSLPHILAHFFHQFLLEIIFSILLVKRDRADMIRKG